MKCPGYGRNRESYLGFMKVILLSYGLKPFQSLNKLYKLNNGKIKLYSKSQGRRGPPGHREIVPVAPENHADMGPLKLSLKKIIQGVSKKLFDVSLNNKKQLYAEWALG